MSIILKMLIFGQIKIDQSFVRDIAVDNSDEIIVQTIIKMGQTLGIAPQLKRGQALSASSPSFSSCKGKQPVTRGIKISGCRLCTTFRNDISSEFL